VLTLPRLVNERLRAIGDSDFFYTKEAGKWVGHSGTEALTRVRAATAGLHDLGIGRGDRVAILADVRPEWGEMDFATLANGAVTVGIYTTMPPSQVRYILSHSEAKAIALDRPEQLEKVREVRVECPALATVIVMDGCGVDPAKVRRDAGERLLSEIEATGRRLLELDPKLYDGLVEAVRPEDLATIIYTSGTTGPPKGAMLTHGNICSVARAMKSVVDIGPEDISIAFLPLAHSLQRVAGYVGISLGTRGAYATSIETLLDDFREIRPTVQPSVPRIWEKAYARIRERVAQSSAIRRSLFEWALGVGRDFGEYRKRGAERFAPPGLRLKHAAAERLVFRRIREFLGGRIRFLTSGGAPISTEVLEFFYALGILITEGYGLTETAAPATFNRPDDFRFGTVGKPIPGTEIRIAEDGEVLIRGPGVFLGYYKDEAATREAFADGGWFKTGDIGEIDADGFLRITDRKKNLIVTATGKKVAPANVEALVKRCPIVSQVYIHGDNRSFLVALVAIDREEAVRAAGAGALPDLRSLAENADVVRAVAEAIEAANRDLARYEQVKKFRIVPEEFSQEQGTLTPTLKIKRKAVEARYQALIEAMYEERVPV